MPQQFTIHYACESLFPKRTSHVTAISVCEIATKKLTTFSMEDVQKTLGIQRDPLEFEAHLLKSFFAFVSEHLDAVWIHWHMDGVEYGFEVLKERFEMLWGEQPPVFVATVNLAERIYEYPQKRCRRYPKMYQLFQENGIDDQAILSGREEAELFKRAEYAQIKHSSRTKAKALAKVYDKLQGQSLVTPCSKQDKKLWIVGVLLFFAAIVYMLVKGG
jgi:L-rhamnose mutarotase